MVVAITLRRTQIAATICPSEQVTAHQHN